jgi:CRISPR system Cascade subunit CasD
MELLILRLQAPIMKWGLHSHWYHRDTNQVPTKSGIVGMIACALGYPRGDKRIEELSNALKMGVREDKKGFPIIDFHIVTANSNPHIKRLNAANYAPRVGEGGILTYRHYLQDAVFTVALAGEPALLHKIERALCDPVFPIYLGAKCCVPSRPVFEEITDDYLSIEDALSRYPLIDGKPPSKHYCEIEDIDGDHSRQDEVRINQMREYGFRRICVKYLGG